MRDWFSSGVDAMSSAFGGGSRSRSNPFAGQSPQGRGNPFAGGNTNGARGNPFAVTMPGTSGYSGYGSYTQDNPIVQFENKAMERLAEYEAQYQGSDYSSEWGGLGESMGKATATGDWFAGGRMNGTEGWINEASAKHGVPANLIKSIIARESSGDWGRDGSRYVYLGSRGEHILPYSGIMESTARAWGYDPQSLIGNQGLQIDAVANGLARLYGQVGDQYGWEGVVNTYYSGDPTGGYTPGDSYQYGTTSQYRDDIMSWWSRLDQEAGVTNYNQVPGGGMGGSWSSAWQGDYAITQEHGPTPWSLGEGAYMYDYAKDVGVQGHPGLDVGMPSGTSLYAPASGTVVIAGGSGYYTDHRGDGPGRGELRVELDNGDILILGHMASISLVPGQRINAGDFVGTSGSYNGDHLHYEVRKRTPGATSSGYTAVDPRQYFSGGGSVGQTQGPSQTPSKGGGLWWQRSLSDLFRRV